MGEQQHPQAHTHTHTHTPAHTHTHPHTHVYLHTRIQPPNPAQRRAAVILLEELVDQFLFEGEEKREGEEEDEASERADVSVMGGLQHPQDQPKADSQTDPSREEEMEEMSVPVSAVGEVKEEVVSTPGKRSADPSGEEEGSVAVQAEVKEGEVGVVVEDGEGDSMLVRASAAPIMSNTARWRSLRIATPFRQGAVGSVFGVGESRKGEGEGEGVVGQPQTAQTQTATTQGQQKEEGAVSLSVEGQGADAAEGVDVETGEREMEREGTVVVAEEEMRVVNTEMEVEGEVVGVVVSEEGEKVGDDDVRGEEKEEEVRRGEIMCADNEGMSEEKSAVAASLVVEGEQEVETVSIEVVILGGEKETEEEERQLAEVKVKTEEEGEWEDEGAGEEGSEGTGPTETHEVVVGEGSKVPGARWKSLQIATPFRQGSGASVATPFRGGFASHILVCPFSPFPLPLFLSLSLSLSLSSPSFPLPMCDCMYMCARYIGDRVSGARWKSLQIATPFRQGSGASVATFRGGFASHFLACPFSPSHPPSPSVGVHALVCAYPLSLSLHFPLSKCVRVHPFFPFPSPCPSVSVRVHILVCPFSHFSPSPSLSRFLCVSVCACVRVPASSPSPSPSV